MNEIKIVTSLDNTQTLIDIFKIIFPEQTSQGEQSTLNDGRIEFKFNLNDEDTHVLKEAFKQAYKDIEGVKIYE